ncbi:hypothetical protein UA08_08688 [Talaromyces atroroseus]|uniref:Uncharacterized protein n=1 Tax=Talaromyces atroroseus TaxID=1441469 RepID=A0A225ANV1_TALAT|nr:hypothetical protein UA08_08688 [Talaromyces atroroseus]OKL56105.1 hypothetical protein UA08_08688 [Talaromyces atroroseus]
MSNKNREQPPAYPAAVHQDAGPYNSQSPPPQGAYYYQSTPPGGAYNGYSSPPPQGYYPPGQPQYGPPQGGYYQQGYQQGYPPQGYYTQQPNRGYSSGADGICAGFSAALALCCCADLCCWLI